MFWLCSQTNGGLGQWSKIMLFFSAEQDSLQKWTMGKRLAMPHRACVLGSATKQQHGNASNLSTTFLHYGVIGSGYSAGIHDVADVHPGRSDPWLDAEGRTAHPHLPDTGVQCSGLIFLLHCLSGLHKLGHHQIETVAHFYPKWGLQNGVFQLNKRLGSNWKKTALSV